MLREHRETIKSYYFSRKLLNKNSTGVIEDAVRKKYYTKANVISALLKSCQVAVRNFFFILSQGGSHTRAIKKFPV